MFVIHESNKLSYILHGSDHQTELLRTLTLWLPNIHQKIPFLTLQSAFLAAMTLTRPKFS